jgi:hypothetical protein
VPGGDIRRWMSWTSSRLRANPTTSPCAAR